MIASVKNKAMEEKRQKMSETLLEDLPDEIILKVLKNLEIRGKYFSFYSKISEGINLKNEGFGEGFLVATNKISFP